MASPPPTSASRSDPPEFQTCGLTDAEQRVCNRIIRNAKPSICFYSHTPEGVFTFLSPSAESIFGFTPEAAVGRNWRDILKAPTETFTSVDAYDQACAKGEVPNPIDAEIYHPERGSIIVEIQDGPVFDAAGRVVAIEGFVVDVTELRTFQRELENLVTERTAALEAANAKLSREIQERRKAEAQLRTSEERYRLLYNRSPIMMQSADASGCLLNVNDQWLNVLGYTRDAVLGRNVADFLSEDCRRTFLETVKPEFIRTGRLHKVPIEMVRQNGDLVHALITANSQRDAAGRIVSSITVVEDVTAVKKVEREARAARERMFQAAKMVSLGTVVSGVAHEINNPISFVMLNAQALQKIWTDLAPILVDYRDRHGNFDAGGFTHAELIAEVPVLLEHIHQGGRRVKKIVDDLKSYARQAPASLDRQVDINLAAGNAIRFTRNLIGGKGHRFTSRLAPDVPTFTGDPQRIEQVLINLLTNAVEALAENTGTIVIDTVYDAAAGRVVCRVQDDGEGVDARDLSRIKDPFFTTKRDMGGMGLGLSVSAGIVEMHGGSIDIVPNADGGVTVTVVFPLDKRPGPTESGE